MGLDASNQNHKQIIRDIQKYHLVVFFNNMMNIWTFE